MQTPTNRLENSPETSDKKSDWVQKILNSSIDGQTIDYIFTKGFDRNGGQKWTVSELSTESIDKIKTIESDEYDIDSIESIDYAVDAYQKVTNAQHKEILYEVIDAWSVQWLEFWYSRYAEACKLSVEEFLSEYRMIVFEAVDKFTIKWDKPNKHGRQRKAHFNGLLYMRLGQRFINNINAQHRSKRAQSHKCPHCDIFVTMITNKHCKEHHGHSLVDFIEMYPRHPISIPTLSLDNNVNSPDNDDAGSTMTIKDGISRNEDHIDLVDLLEIIGEVVGDDEKEYLHDAFLNNDAADLEEDGIIESLRKNKKLKAIITKQNNWS